MTQIKEPDKSQKLIHMIKKIWMFILIIIIKLSERPEQTTPKAKEATLPKLMKSLYLAISRSISGNLNQKKKSDQDKTTHKRSFKTWAHVKEDYKNWYASLVAEIEEKIKTDTNQKTELVEKKLNADANQKTELNEENVEK